MKPMDITIFILLLAALVWPLLKLVSWIHLWCWRATVMIGTKCYFIDFQDKKFSGTITDIQKPIKDRMNYSYYLFRGNNALAVVWLPLKNIYFPGYGGKRGKSTATA